MASYPLLKPEGPGHSNSGVYLAEADLRDSDIRSHGKPHITLDCGHLSPPGNGPLAQDGKGWFLAHGIVPIAVQPDAS